jgi:GntR family transcriptional regulator
MDAQGTAKRSALVRSPSFTDAPLYKEVRRTLLQCLAKGEWRPGDRLPPEPQLATRFGVAIPTVRAGVADLVAAGVLIRRQGKGTFVAQHDAAQELRFSNIFDHRNQNISTVRTSVRLRRIKADPEAAHLLELDLRQPAWVYHIDAVLEAHDRPVGLMELIVPLPLFADLSKEHLEQSADNLYSVYQRVCGVTVLRMDERVYARTADRNRADMLDLQVFHPLLVVERLAYTFDDRPIEIRRRCFDGMQHHYLFKQKRLD